MNYRILAPLIKKLFKSGDHRSMDNRFFERPIINSPYEYPTQYWELDAQGQPTQQIIEPAVPEIHHPHSQAQETQDRYRPGGPGLR